MFYGKGRLVSQAGAGLYHQKAGGVSGKAGKGDTQAIENAIQTVKDGGIFSIFPEGTRSRTGELGKPKSGAVLVAHKTGGDIVPCCIKFEGKLHFRSRVTVVFGGVIKNEELGITDITPASLKEASKYMMSKIAEIYGDGHP